MAVAKAFEARTQIDRSPEQVWDVLVDTQAWPQWDPFCEKIEGAVREGGTIKAYTTLSPGRAFPVKVAHLDKGRKMIWRGGMPFGLFVGERTFTLEPKDEGTAVVVREEFRGPLSGLIAKSIPDMSEAFDAFVAGLKERSEASR